MVVVEWVGGGGGGGGGGVVQHSKCSQVKHLQKRMDSLQEAFIHATELCEERFITYARALFDVF